MNKLLVIPSIIFLSMNTFAGSIECIDRLSMKIPGYISPIYNLYQETDKSYTLSVTTSKASDRTDDYITTILADKLDCDIDGVIASCKQGYSTSSYTSVSIEEVMRKAINPFTKLAQIQESMIEMTYQDKLVRFKLEDCYSINDTIR